MKKAFTSILSVALAVLTAFSLVFCFSSCGSTTVDPSDAVKLSFKSGSDFSYLQSLEGKTVTINGYLATSSPADGSFIFLMNLPYQSCPFCKPNTSQLSNTIEVYPAKGKSFGYTTSAVKVTGVLEVAESEDKPFTDDYGYEFAFKISNASYTILSAEELGDEMALWTKVAESGLVSDLYNMFNYVDFVCNWPNYWVNDYTDADGTTYPGYYLYASDALSFIKDEGQQYNYGYVKGYFESLIKRVQNLDPEKLSALVTIIEKSKAIADEALAALEAGNYTSTQQYVEKFNTTDYIFTFPTGEKLAAEFENVYTEFSDWLGGFEM